ncbi:MAG: hypothetical protein A4E53_01369 [Pelotomaculum sp. PtaB.Bin104]|nr:MAG: hypothetical protein A4E53_01369 [Pelotomaculum sp. PtaB.Bin104]
MEYYELIVHGHLGARRAESFEGLELRPLPDGSTQIAGFLRDQAELHAMLSRIRDLGITLVSVKLIKEDAAAKKP